METNDLCKGIAQRFHVLGIGVYRTGSAVYQPGEVGVVIGLPTTTPPALIALLAYDTRDDPTSSDTVQSIQIRYRSAVDTPDQANDLADSGFNALQGMWGEILNGIKVITAERRSSLPLGTDNSGRYERSDNYDLTIHRPSTHRE